MPSGVNLSSPSAEQLNGIFSGNGSSSGSLLTAPASQFFVEKNGFPTYWPSNHLSDPGDAFLTFYDAAYAAVNKYNPLSVSQNLEYGGLVYQQGAHGLYSYTVPDIGTADQVNAFSAVQQFEVPAGAHVVADWHTHAGQSIFYDNEHFSPADIRGSNAVKRIDFPDYRGRFLGTPSGNFLFWPYGRAPGKPAIDLGSVSN